MLTTHVVSRELAEELKAAGWPQGGSCFAWFRWRKSGKVFLDEGSSTDHSLTVCGKTDHAEKIAAAPLATELMGRMPTRVNPADRWHRFFIKYWKTVYIDGETIYRANGEDDCCLYGEEYLLDTPIEEPTFPDALAKLALHLIKEGILKP